MYNVAYDNLNTGKTRMYLGDVVTLKSAIRWMEAFKEVYIGKPYPNGKGIYPYHNVRVVQWCPISNGWIPAKKWQRHVIRRES